LDFGSFGDFFKEDAIGEFLAFLELDLLGLLLFYRQIEKLHENLNELDILGFNFFRKLPMNLNRVF
jgi:hypothetical protein